MKVSKKNIKWVMIESGIIVLLYFTSLIFAEKEKEFQINIIAFWALFVIIQSLTMVKKINHSFNSYSILIILIGCFMYGQHILFLLGINPRDMVLLTDRVSQKAMYNTSFFVLYSIVTLNIGYILSCKAHKIEQRDIQHVNNENENNRVGIYFSGIVFFFISLPPTLITLFTNIWHTFTIGYGERMTNSAYQVSGISNLSGILSGFMVPALLAMFVARKPGKKFPIIAMASYMFLYTISGSRIYTVILLIGTLYVQNTLFQKLNIKKMVKYGIFAIVFLLVMSTVSVARSSIGSSSDNISIIKESIGDVLDNNIIVASLSEAGYTFSATATVLDNCPNKVGYIYGRSYLRGIAYILPNGVTGNYYAKVGSTDETFKKYLSSYGSGIGSSFLAEAFWNFGYFSLIVIFLFGILLGKLSNALDLAIKGRQYLKIFILTYIFVVISFYVRSDTSTFFRNIVWFGVPIILMAKHMANKQRTSQAPKKG